jgi:hypothetical protein
LYAKKLVFRSLENGDRSTKVYKVNTMQDSYPFTFLFYEMKVVVGSEKYNHDSLRPSIVGICFKAQKIKQAQILQCSAFLF